MNTKTTLLVIALFLLAFTASCGSENNALSVSELIQNAQSLDGKTVRVQGQAYLWIEPEMVMRAGCTPPQERPAAQEQISGYLMLFDEVDLMQPPDRETGVLIDKSAFGCEGDSCSLTCAPFEAVAGRSYELVGTLIVNDRDGRVEYILKDVDLKASRQLVYEEWAPIPEGEFKIFFP